MIRIAWKRIPRDACPHRDRLREDTTSATAACEPCGHGESPRICLTCGYVACCESHGAHNTEHFKKTGHPFIRPQGGGATWFWCYECDAFLA